MNLNGAGLSKTENIAPWSLTGDKSGNYHPWTATAGSYTFTAKGYELDNATGTAGVQYSVSFSLVDGGTSTPPEA